MQVADHVARMAQSDVVNPARGRRSSGMGGFFISTSVVYYLVANRTTIWRTAIPLGVTPHEVSLHGRRGHSPSDTGPCSGRCVDLFVALFEVARLSPWSAVCCCSS